MMGSLSELKRLLHWGPILALTVIAVISTMTMTCTLQWWHVTSLGGAINMAIFILFNVATLYNFFNAAFIGPGHVKLGWSPPVASDQEHLQFCTICKGYKAPRSHHCRKCNRCVMKMDHHCPWINNCVGHFNHAYFTYFLFYAPLGCIQAICILIPAMYRALNRHYYLYYGTGEEPLVTLSINQFIASMFSVGLSVGVIIAVGGLLYIQVRTILRNETGIESWIIEKAQYREREEGEEEFVFPYNFGRKKNWWLVFSRKPDPRMDGTWWPVKAGCTQYTLTIEQLKQKREKKDRSVVYAIREAYSGRICPCSKGVKVGCCPPITDEPRIPLTPGDRVLVSRWKKRWLYGDKLLPEDKMNGVLRERGWFPRVCAMEILHTGESGEMASGETTSRETTSREATSRAEEKKEN